MFVNRVSIPANLRFKGYNHEKNDVGQSVLRFNYPYDTETETCEVHIYRANLTGKYNYNVDETPVKILTLEPEGKTVNINELPGFGKNTPFAYKIVRKDKATGDIIWQGSDTGMKIRRQGDEYVYKINEHDPVEDYSHTIVSRKGTTPMVYGTGYLAIPDTFMPGVRYAGFNEENTGEIIVDMDKQKKTEGILNHSSNSYGGNLAGLEHKAKYFKDNNYKHIFTTPIANGAEGYSLGYWAKNNNQMSSSIGNLENFNSFVKTWYANGRTFVYDATYTSESLEGIHFQHLIRHAQETPQSYYWFIANGIKDSSLGLGVIPKNKENLRHELINAPYKYELESNGQYKKVKNPEYKSDRETYIRIYDNKKVDNANINELDFVTHDDTVINYKFEIDWKDYDKNVMSVINLLNKKEGEKVSLDSALGTELACRFPNFQLTKKTEGGFVTWDAKSDMPKRNHQVSGYIEKLLNSIESQSEREYVRKMYERGALEVQDMDIQSARYWTKKVKDIVTVYGAQTVGSAKTVDEINKLIAEGKLPEEVQLNSETLSNILNGFYMFKPKGVMSKDDVTVQALMSMPLDAVEFGENTVGVLSTSYFSNRATSEETLGLTRFELMKQNNPHLVEPYSKNYNKMNAIYNNELKEFANKIIEKINETSNEKLLDSEKNYTEYGEYVIELMGQDIVRYAMLKALAGENFKTKLLSNGEITYDYDAIKESTTLKGLGIFESSSEAEATALLKKIKNGLEKVSNEDVDYIAGSISKRLNGVDVSSFRIAEAMYDRFNLMNFRFDAAKDIMDMDGIRNKNDAFDDNAVELIKYWERVVDGIRTEHANTGTIAENTDIPDLMRDTYGLNSLPYYGGTNIGQVFNGEPDFYAKFFNETGITSEAGYSYFFTDLLTAFSPSFDMGDGKTLSHDRFVHRFKLLLETRNPDYLRNLYTFMGNQDKPRLIHGLAVDMEMFHSNILNDNYDFEQSHKTRQAAIQVLSGAATEKDIPLELRLNVDNNEYFKTVSSRTVAESKLLMDIINNDLKDIISEKDRKNINSALVDITSGHYLDNGKTEGLTVINIPELSSLENAFAKILEMARANGMSLTNTEYNVLLKAVVDKANSKVEEKIGGEGSNKNVYKYLVHGDYDWTVIDPVILGHNISNAKDVLGDCPDYNKYSIYTVQLAKLLKDSYKETGLNANLSAAIDKAIKDFAEKYDRETVNSNSSEFRKLKSPEEARKEYGYAARDLKTSIEMAIKQAEYKTGEPIANREEIIAQVYKSATEPAISKALMIMSALNGLNGINTMYAGDEFGMTGYEEKATNNTSQNRNVLPWSHLEEDNTLANHTKATMSKMNEIAKEFNDSELSALRSGTPYQLEVTANNLTTEQVKTRIRDIWRELDKCDDETTKQALTKELKDLSSFAFMQQDANGNATITMMNFADVEYSNRFNYFEKYGLDTEEKRQKFFEENEIGSLNPNNPYVPISEKREVDAIMLGSAIALPVGAIFINASSKDKTEYVVKKIGDKKGIVKRDGGKIVMNGKTAKNGVMILKQIKKWISFKGNSKQVYYNPHYGTEYVYCK